MRYRLMATYQGVPYEAGIGPSDGDVVLFAACPPPEELGFEPATGHWRKQLRTQDVQALWESRPMGSYRGQGCMVLDDLGDRLHIAYLGHDAFQAQQLGYWQVDRGVFELVTGREEVTEVTEERSDYLTTAAVPVPDPQPAAGYSAADYGPVTADYGPAADYGPGPGYGPATSDFPAVTPAAGGPFAPEPAASTPFPPDPFPSSPSSFPSSPAPAAPFPPAPSPSSFPSRSSGSFPSGSSGSFSSGSFPPAPVPPAAGLDPIPPRSSAGSISGGRPRPLSPDFGTQAGQDRLPSPLRPGPGPAEPFGAAGPLAPGYTVVPEPSEAPLPLEAAARRAASAAGDRGLARRDTWSGGPAGRNGSSGSPVPPARPMSRPSPATVTDMTTPDLLAAPALATMTATAPAPPLGTSHLSASSLTAPWPAAPLPEAPVSPAPMSPAPMTASGMAPPPAGVSGSAPPSMTTSAVPPPAMAPPAGPAGATDRGRRRRSAQSRMATQGIFTELASLAAIPAAAYAVGEEVDGALCLIETDTGYEVFSAAGGARHEVRTFEDEESAYFYLFGVLAAEAVRTGLLIPHH